MLIVHELYKKFSDIVAVESLSFQVNKGIIFGLLGPNGAGKTTTIRAILNIIRPTSGYVTLNGKEIKKEMLNLVGYLPEDRGIYKKSRVLDTLLYFAALKGLHKTTALKEAEEWLKKLNIFDLRKKRIDELSKGNQQKVQFISSIIHNPELLILDEPFSGFDPINQQLIKEILLSLRDAGKIIILSTHQMETAEKLCSEILLINQGNALLSGSISSIKQTFGKNSVRVDYEGDCSFIKSLSYVKHVDEYSNYAEVELIPDVQGDVLLNEIVSRLKVKQFTLIEPTLNKIFIDVVRGNK
jgi:ABC-2 type transport system ATP-binding protein